MSVLKKLTEGIVSRNLSRDGAAIMDKWEKTGLLEGITDENKRQGMARLLGCRRFCFGRIPNRSPCFRWTYC